MVEQYVNMDVLRRDGIWVMPGLWATVAAFSAHLVMCPAYRNHVRQGKSEIVKPGDHPWTCYDMGDVVRAPGLLECAIALTPIAAAYLEAPSVLYSLNAFNCEPNVQPKSDIQGWHRDTDDVRFLALFAYITDVNCDGDGPHEFMIGSHRGTVPPGNRRSIYGPAGTMFLADTRALHMGAVPQYRRRTIAWARWGVTRPPASYVWDGLAPTPRADIGDRYPSDPLMRDAISLVVA
jgi:hypothetical protein